MNFKKSVLIVFILYIVLSCASSSAQTIQNFENGILEFFSAHQDSANKIYVENGKLNFHYQRNSSSTATTYIYNQKINLKKNFCIDLNMSVDDLKKLNGNILWRNYYNGLGFFNMVGFSNGNIIFTDASTHILENKSFRLKICGDNESITTYIDGKFVNESEIPENFSSDEELELRIEFNNSACSIGEEVLISIDNLKFNTSEAVQRDVIVDNTGFYFDFGRDRIRQENYLDPFEKMYVNIKVGNFSDDEKTAVLIDGENYNSQKIKLLPGEVKTVKAEKSSIVVEKNKELKYYLWDGLEKLVPITTTQKIENDGVVIPTVNSWRATFSNQHNGQIWITNDKIEKINSMLDINSLNYDEEFSGYWSQVIKEGQDLLDDSVQNYGESLGVQPANRIYERIVLLGTLYKVTSNDEYAQRAYREMENAANFIDWHDEHFLDTAAILSGMAVGYDTLYSYMEDEEKSFIAKAIYEKGILPGLKIYQEGNDTWDTRKNNWNIICNSGMGMAAMSIGNLEAYKADCSEVMNTALRNLRLAMHSFSEEGSWFEGPSYSTYMLINGIDFMQMLQNAYQDTFGYESMTNFRNNGRYLVALNGAQNFYNYDDCEMGSLISSSRMFYFANLTNDYTLAKYHILQLENSPAEIRDVLWYDSKYKTANISGINNDFYDSQLKLVSFRDDYDNNTYLACNAGNNLSTHSQLDMGSFVYDACGVRWFYDLGSDNYNLYEFLSYNSYKWYYYRNRAEGHNCMIFNPGKYNSSDVKTAPDQIVEAEGEITDIRKKYDDYSYVVMDLTNAYKEDCSSYTRKLSLEKEYKSMIIHETIDFDKQTEAYWFAHTAADTTVCEDKKSAILSITENNVEKKLFVKIVQGDGNFSTMDASALPTSPNPDLLQENIDNKLTQNKNVGFKKLTIHNTYNQGINELVIIAIPYENREYIEAALSRAGY